MAKGGGERRAGEVRGRGRGGEPEEHRVRTKRVRVERTERIEEGGGAQDGNGDRERVDDGKGRVRGREKRETRRARGDLEKCMNFIALSNPT